MGRALRLEGDWWDFEEETGATKPILFGKCDCRWSLLYLEKLTKAALYKESSCFIKADKDSVVPQTVVTSAALVLLPFWDFYQGKICLSAVHL